MKLIVIFLSICAFLLVACDSRTEQGERKNKSTSNQDSGNDNESDRDNQV